jgi:hypothetical protein
VTRSSLHLLNAIAEHAQRAMTLRSPRFYERGGNGQMHAYRCRQSLRSSLAI